jgi:hypothetical protein
VRRRLLKRLQHRIEGRLGKHMNFVDYEHLEAPANRHVSRVVLQRSHLVYASIGSCVDFDEVRKPSAIDFSTGTALAAGLGSNPGFAVEAFGENPRQRGLADAARSGKQVGMVQPLRLECVAQSLDDMLLPDQAGEAAWTPLAGQDLVAHRIILAASRDNDAELTPTLAAQTRLRETRESE